MLWAGTEILTFAVFSTVLLLIKGRSTTNIFGDATDESR